MQNVVIGFLGTVLDLGRKRKWRPTISLCAQEGFEVDRLEILHDAEWRRLALQVQRDIAEVSPHTEVLLHETSIENPWDFEEVYACLFDFAAQYGFDEDRERYHVHLTTGTHVAQICWFLLTESRHIPARLLQTRPPEKEAPYGRFGAAGYVDLIDLDLSRYNAIQQRFDVASREYNALLKDGIETKNPGFNALIDRLERVATASDAPILLEGETGTGKTALARRIYELKLQRRRLKGRFVHVPAAALTGPEAQAALFGRRRGVTGGAGSERAGLLREADGGLLFLDEIDELSPEAQGLLLHAIEHGRYLPVGADHEVTSRFHVIAGSNRDLGGLAAAGALRPDLLARLSTWRFTLPPLRERPEDLPPNIEHELSRAEKILGMRFGFNVDAAAAYRRFARDPASRWSGNFRDLGASVLRLCTLAERGRITMAMVEEEIALLRAQWAGQVADPDMQLLRGLLGAQAEEIDEFDAVQLAAVIRACRASDSVSAAGRRLFAASRARRASKNDADRLRKYLARFDLDWEMVSRTH